MYVNKHPPPLTGAYAGGWGAVDACAPLPPGKKVPLRNVQKNEHVPLRYDKIKTQKVGKKEEKSKRKGIELKK